MRTSESSTQQHGRRREARRCRRASRAASTRSASARSTATGRPSRRRAGGRGAARPSSSTPPRGRGSQKTPIGQVGGAAVRGGLAEQAAGHGEGVRPVADDADDPGVGRARPRPGAAGQHGVGDASLTSSSRRLDAAVVDRRLPGHVADAGVQGEEVVVGRAPLPQQGRAAARRGAAYGRGPGASSAGAGPRSTAPASASSALNVVERPWRSARSSSSMSFLRRRFCSTHMPITRTGLSSAKQREAGVAEHATITPAISSGAATVTMPNSGRRRVACGSAAARARRRRPGRGAAGG